MDNEPSNVSAATAQLALEDYRERVGSAIGAHVAAIVLVGSLATGSYVPGESDIDQITILHDRAPACAEQVLRQCRQAAMDNVGGSVNLADVFYRLADLYRPWRTEWDLTPETKHLVAVPEELLRLHDHGRVIQGDPEIIVGLPHPTRNELVAYEKRWRHWHAEYQIKHPEFAASIGKNLTPRVAAQSILSRAIWHHYFATGDTCFNKHLIGERLRRDVPGYLFQDAVDLATRVRMRASQDVTPGEFAALRNGCDRLREWCGDRCVAAVPVC